MAGEKAKWRKQRQQQKTKLRSERWNTFLEPTNQPKPVGEQRCSSTTGGFIFHFIASHNAYAIEWSAEGEATPAETIPDPPLPLVCVSVCVLVAMAADWKLKNFHFSPFCPIAIGNRSKRAGLENGATHTQRASRHRIYRRPALEMEIRPDPSDSESVRQKVYPLPWENLDGRKVVSLLGPACLPAVDPALKVRASELVHSGNSKFITRRVQSMEE